MNNKEILTVARRLDKNAMMKKMRPSPKMSETSRDCPPGWLYANLYAVSVSTVKSNLRVEVVRGVWGADANGVLTP